MLADAIAEADTKAGLAQNSSTTRKDTRVKGGVLLFVTQGLDLAIPSASTWLDTTFAPGLDLGGWKPSNLVKNWVLKRPKVQVKIAKTGRSSPFPSCKVDNAPKLSLEWIANGTSAPALTFTYTITHGPNSLPTTFAHALHPQKHVNSKRELLEMYGENIYLHGGIIIHDAWVSHPDPEETEAVCITVSSKVTGNTAKPRHVCASRIAGNPSDTHQAEEKRCSRYSGSWHKFSDGKSYAVEAGAEACTKHECWYDKRTQGCHQRRHARVQPTKCHIASTYSSRDGLCKCNASTVCVGQHCQKGVGHQMWFGHSLRSGYYLMRCPLCMCVAKTATTAEAGGKKQKLNVLSLLIDPISDRHLSRALPRTTAVLRKLGFVHFTNYSVVGFNSGPNQAALFGDISMTARQNIRTSNASRWIWVRSLQLNAIITRRS